MLRLQPSHYKSLPQYRWRQQTLRKQRRALVTHFRSVAASNKLKCPNPFHLVPQTAYSLPCQPHPPPLVLKGCVVILIWLDVWVRSHKKNVCLPDIIYDRVLEPRNSEVKSLCKHFLLYTSNTTKYYCTVSTFNCKWYLGINPLSSAVMLCDMQIEEKDRCGGPSM